MASEIIVLLALLLLSVVLNVVLWRKDKNNTRKVSFLFNAIDNGDYSFRFPTENRDEDKLLNASLNRIKTILQHARDEQIEREKYYEVILDSVDTGILVVDDSRGLVLRTNKAARQMLGRETITHISQVSEKLKAFATRESHTMLKGRKVKVIGFSDIHGELANQEVDAWVKLIRVLTHEIMNTITPIISLSSLSEGENGQISGRDFASRMKVIHDTSKELMDFVQNYRKFTHVPTPQPNLFYVKPFLERMAGLTRNWLKKECTIKSTIEPKDLLVYADESLVSRVVSNLLKNAAEATPEGGHIMMSAYTSAHDNVTIDITDDGEPIPDDVAAQIFIPFFTTKKGGSGIGLSISRRIMRAMGGMIELVRENGKTTFRLTFQ